MLFAFVGLVLVADAPKLVKPVSLHALTTSSVLIDFETDLPVDAEADVQCHLPSNPADAWARDRDTRHHSLRLTGARIRPDQRCHYVVRSGSSDLASGAFWTSPPAGSKTPFSFAVVGDSRDHARWAQVAHAILEKHPRFVLTTGDANDRGDDPAAWRDYYTAAAPLFAETPVFAAMGNHDLGPRFAALNPAPETGAGPSTYAFRYGNAAFLALDSNRAEDEAQERFARRALKALSGGPLFVFQHHPLYSCGAHGSDRELRARYQGLFEQTRVSFDFAGHDHDLILWNPVGGVRYAVSGGGGAVTYPLSGCEGPFAYEGDGFLLVTVEGAVVRGTFFDACGSSLHEIPPFQAAGPSAPAVDLRSLVSD